jgi:hypothetical protein
VRKVLFLIFLCFCLSLIQKANAASSASQTISATLAESGGGGGGGNGIAIGIATGGSAAVVTGASAFAFAPILLAGLSPNSVVYAAAPIDGITAPQSFLQTAVVYHMHTKTYMEALERMKTNGKFYLAQNNTEIINGTFDMQSLTLPKELQSAQKIKVNITIASQKYKAIDGEPELTLGLYKDISKPNLSKKFETQQFLHHYLMKRYETPLKIEFNGYDKGFQKLSGIVDMRQVQNKQLPMQVVLRYTENGFKVNQKTANPKTLIYAYLIEFEK